MDIESEKFMRFTGRGGVTAAKGFEARCEHRLNIKTKWMCHCIQQGCLRERRYFYQQRGKGSARSLGQKYRGYQETAQAVVVNSGICDTVHRRAGRGTIKTGEMCRQLLGIPADAVLVASTGVIGMQIPETDFAALRNWQRQKQIP